MLIYRIEHKYSGVGPYWHGEDISVLSGWGFGFTDKHPDPENDSLLAPKVAGLSWVGRNKYKFGFSSIEQLRAWFYDDDIINKLSQEDFILAVCDVADEDVLTGYSQCMFIRPKEYYKLDLLKTLT